MIKGHNFRTVGYMSLCGVLLFWVPMQPMAELQPILRVPQDFPTIQAAVDAAPEGATILIAPGTYEESIIITKNLVLEGSGIYSTILRPPAPPLENPVLTVQAPERVVTLRVRQLTVRSPDPELPTGIGVKVLTNASVVLEQTAWSNLLVVIAASSLHRLAIRDSLFEQDYIFIDEIEGGFTLQEAILERNRFIEGPKIALYGQRLTAYDNTVICSQELWRYPFGISVGIAFNLVDEGSRAEIARNSVALCQRGIAMTQHDVKEASVVIQGNWLLANNRSISLGGIGRLAEGVPTRLNWLIEGNIIVSGGIGIEMKIGPAVEGGQVHLVRNRIAWQRKQYVEKFSPPADILYFGNGILLWPSLRQKDLKEPLNIEISENQIEHNEAWGLALNLAAGLEGQPDQCNVKAPGEEQIFIDPEITGSGNIFRNNGKGDLCPPDYPWPPGFRK